MMLPGALGEIAEVAAKTRPWLLPMRAAVRRSIFRPFRPKSTGCASWSGWKRPASLPTISPVVWRGGGSNCRFGPAGHGANVRAKVDAMLRAGASERDIALATRYTTRAIRRRCAKLGLQDQRQLRLF